jgi:hypothetical protein
MQPPYGTAWLAPLARAAQMTAFDPADRLCQHAQGLVGRSVGGTELIEVMRLLRLVLEKEKARDSFPHAALYCDWLLHNEIDKHEIAVNILSQMHAAIVDWDRTHDLAPVSRALSLAQLRAEMLVIFAKHKIPTDLMDSFLDWRSFLGVLLHDLSQRPLRLPKKKNKLHSAIAEMTSLVEKRWVGSKPFWTRAMFITCEAKGENEQFFFLNLEWESPHLVGNDHVIIKSELGMTEELSAFRRQ